MQNGIKRAIGFGLAWFGATALAVIVAAAAVGSVRSQVTDTPTPLGSPETAALAADAPADDPVTAPAEPAGDDAPTEPLATTVPPTDSDQPLDDVEMLTTTIPETTTTSPPEPTPTTTTTVAETTRTTTTTTSPPQTTTTTAPTTTTTTVAPASYTRTYDTVAGSVRVRVEGESVTFAGAFPQPGWSVELKNGGPEKVEVEFDQNDGEGEVEFTAKVEDGELVVEIDVE